MRRNGFTLIELLVVVAVLALLAAILLPVFARARYQSYKVVCTAHQRQLAVALRAYIDHPAQTPLISDSYLIPRKQSPLVLSGLISGRHLESPASLHPGPSRDNRLNTILMTATDLHARTIFVRLRPDGEERTYPQRPMLLDGTRVPVWLVDTGPFRAYPFLDGVPRDDPRIPGRLEVRCPARGVYGG